MSRLSEFLRLARKRDDCYDKLEHIFSNQVIKYWNDFNRSLKFQAEYNNSVTIQGYAMRYENYWNYEEDRN